MSYVWTYLPFRVGATISIPVPLVQGLHASQSRPPPHPNSPVTTPTTAPSTDAFATADASASNTSLTDTSTSGSSTLGISLPGIDSSTSSDSSSSLKVSDTISHSAVMSTHGSNEEPSTAYPTTSTSLLAGPSEPSFASPVSSLLLPNSIGSSQAATAIANHHSNHTGAIAGGIIGGLIFLGLIILALFYRRALLKRLHRNHTAPSAEFVNHPEFIHTRQNTNNTLLRGVSPYVDEEQPPPFTPGSFNDPIVEKVSATVAAQREMFDPFMDYEDRGASAAAGSRR